MDLRAVRANGLRLAYHEWGEPGAAPVVLLHGLGGSGGDWEGVAAELAADGHRVYAPDLRGHGNSDWPGDYSVELMRDDVEAFVGALGLGSPAVIGHSMGAAVAYLLAATRPGRVSRLVLEEPPPPDPVDQPREVPTGPGEDEPYDWRMVADLRRWINAPDPAWWKLFDSIGCPTLVLAGGPTSTLSQPGITAIADRVPDARLVTIDAGHHVHGNRPEEFLAEVRAFL